MQLQDGLAENKKESNCINNCFHLWIFELHSSVNLNSLKHEIKQINLKSSNKSTKAEQGLRRFHTQIPNLEFDVVILHSFHIESNCCMKTKKGQGTSHYDTRMTALKKTTPNQFYNDGNIQNSNTHLELWRPLHPSEADLDDKIKSKTPTRFKIDKYPNDKMAKLQHRLKQKSQKTKREWMWTYIK